MAKIIGRKEAVGIGLEAVRGTGVAATYLLPKTDYNFEDKANKARSGEGFGHISGEGSQSIVASKFSEGSIEAEVGAKYFPLILSNVFGTISSAAEVSDYKHTIALNNNNIHPTLSIHVDSENGDLLFKGVMADSFEMTVAQDEIVKFSSGLKGKVSVDDVWDSSALLSTDYKFVGRDLIFKVAAATGDLAAASALCVKDLSITITKNVDYDFCLGTLEPEDILNKSITIQGTITLNYEDRTWADYMLDGDYKAVGIKLTNTRQTMTSENPEFYLELPVCDFSEWEAPRTNDEIIQQTINFTALFDVANNRLISDCYVINNVASY